MRLYFPNKTGTIILYIDKPEKKFTPLLNLQKIGTCLYVGCNRETHTNKRYYLCKQHRLSIFEDCPRFDDIIKMKRKPFNGLITKEYAMQQV